ncbi:MAG: SDR family oxidoreductase [Bacteroidales bacterium]|nr:SDR family oxidoreductase [Bacteroidales bacterium]
MLKDKVIVVTGGAGLLGREFVNEIVHQNGIAVIGEINDEIAQKVKNENVEGGVETINIDITSEDSVQSAISEVHKKFGKIDALVNNAYPRNKNYGKHFFDVTYDDFVQNVGMNLGGYFLTSQKFSEFFLKQGYGNIVNISSIYGVVAPRFEIYEGTHMTTPVEYAAIKSALIHLTKYLAKYLKNKNIKVNSISLGGIFDNQPISFIERYRKHTLNKGMLNVSDVSGTLVYLLSDMSEYVNGQNIIVDDGFVL